MRQCRLRPDGGLVCFQRAWLLSRNPRQRYLCDWQPDRQKGSDSFGRQEVPRQEIYSKNIYIQSANLNGKPLTQPWLSHEQIISGGTFHLVMGPNPNREWGSAPNVRPPATMPAGFPYPELPPPSNEKRMAFSMPAWLNWMCWWNELVQSRHEAPKDAPSLPEHFRGPANARRFPKAPWFGAPGGHERC